MAAILNSTLSNLAILDSAILVFPSQTHSHLPRLVPIICTEKLHSYIVTQLDDGSHLEFCHHEFCHVWFSHLGFSHHSISSQTHSHLPRLVSHNLYTKNFTHSFWLNLLKAAILNSAHLGFTLPSCIQTPCYLLSDSLKNTLPPVWLWLKLIKSDSNSFILT